MNKTPIATANNTIRTLNMSKALASTSLDQVTAKEYLQSSVFPKLEVALNTVSFFSYSRFKINFKYLKLASLTVYAAVRYN